MTTVREGFRALFMRDYASSFILQRQGKFDWDKFYEQRKRFVITVVDNLLSKLMEKLKNSKSPLIALGLDGVFTALG